MVSWFGSLDLAYKYAIVLGSLLFLVLLAGFIKVKYNRNRLKKFIKAAELEAAAPQECEKTDELNTRELDEGDFFGIRAIQSGYFGGVAQSRPTSAAGSHSPTCSFAPNFPPTSPLNSVGHVPLDIQQPVPARPPGPLPGFFLLPTKPARALTPKTGYHVPSPLTNPGLRPSHPEPSGRINYDRGVNMSLQIFPRQLKPSRPHYYHLPRTSTLYAASISSGSNQSYDSGLGSRTTAGSSGGSRSPSPSSSLLSSSLFVFPFPRDQHHM